MAEAILGLDFEIHGGGSDLIFPHHENEAAQTCAARGAPLARLWMHNGMVRLGDEKMAKSVGNIFVLHEALGQLRPRRPDHVLLRRALPPADRVRRRAPGAGRGARPADPRGRAQAARRGRRPTGRRRCASASSRRSADDFNTPRRAGGRVRVGPRGQPPSSAAWATPTCARCSACWRSRTCSRPTRCRGAGRGARACADARERARAARDYAEADRLRDEQLRELGWEVRDGPDGPELLPGCRDRLRPQPGARGAARPAAGARASWATKRAPREPWLRRRRGAEVGRGGAEEIERRCASADHQGVCAEVEPFRYADADALLAADAPLDRRARPGAGPAEPRRDLPHRRVRRRDRRGDPRAPVGRGDAAVCKASAARSSIWRSPGCATSPTSWPTRRRAGCWCYGADGGAPLRYDAVDFAGASCSCSGRRAAACVRASPAACDALVCDPAARPDRVAERRGGRGRAAVRALASAIRSFCLTDSRSYVKFPPGDNRQSKPEAWGSARRREVRSQRDRAPSTSR